MSISTHVLDTARGEPARGVRVELYADEVLVAARETDGDGRVRDLARALEPGTYRLVFHPPSPFFSRIEAEFTIDDAGRHHHLPLLLSPYACAIYRGS